jgi:hypothetical protein
LPGIDVLVVSLGTTGGWRSAAGELVAGLRRAGAVAEIVAMKPGRSVRTFALTDLVQAHAARSAAKRGIAEHAPSAIVYCSVTASLLWPAPGAIGLDSTATENRPGRHGVWQRVLERRRLIQAPLVLPWSTGTLKPVAGLGLDAVVLPPPVEASMRAVEAVRDVDVVAYAGDPVKRRLDLILRAWARARRDGETLVVAGTDAPVGGVGVEVTGPLAPAEYRALLRRARVAVAAPRREDHGLAALEALADGCMLVTTPSPGPYPALGLARKLDPRLVVEDLARGLRIALDDPSPGYAERASELLTQFSRAAVDRTLAQRVLPRLMPGWERE